MLSNVKQHEQSSAEASSGAEKVPEESDGVYQHTQSIVERPTAILVVRLTSNRAGRAAAPVGRGTKDWSRVLSATAGGHGTGTTGRSGLWTGGRESVPARGLSTGPYANASTPSLDAFLVLCSPTSSTLGPSLPSASSLSLPSLLSPLLLSWGWVLLPVLRRFPPARPVLALVTVPLSSRRPSVNARGSVLAAAVDVWVDVSVG